MISFEFIKYLFVMAFVTYFIRAVPLMLVKKTIKNKFIVSFLYYIPPAVLTVMTVPSIFYAASFIPAVIAFCVAVILAYFERPLVVVAAFSCLGVLITDFGMSLC